MSRRPKRPLLVVRDRAHARAAASAGAARGQVLDVWTLKELFDRLQAWAMLDLDAVRDDRAGVWSAAAALGAGLAPRAAHDADDLRRALVHGGATATEVLARLPAEDDLRSMFAPLAAAELRLARAGRVDGAGALSHATVLLARGALPAALSAFSDIEVRDLVEPTELELRALIALARAGLPLRACLPVDSLGRGLLAGVEPVLKSLEAAHDVPLLDITLDDIGAAQLDGPNPGMASFACAFYGGTTAPSAPVEVLIAPDEAAEAREVADVVAGWLRAGRAAGGRGASVCVALRSLDDGAARIADALAGHHIAVRMRRRRLPESAAARLILDVIALARDGAPRDRMLAVLASPALRGALSSSLGARVLRVLRRAAARTDVEDSGAPRGGYRHRLTRYRSGLDDEPQQLDVDMALEHVERALAWARQLPREARLAEHLAAVARVAREIFEDGRELGCAEVLDVLEESTRAAKAVSAANDPLVDLAAVSALVERAIERSLLPSLPVDDDDAVEILTLPETWGRQFDHVVVAGCVEGKLPRVERGERLLADIDRARVNTALGRRVLRLIDDDPLEPSPLPRAQALEPLWMLGAIRAARVSLLLTMPRRDGRGRELPESVFLLEAARALALTGDSPLASLVRFVRAPSPRAIEVRAAQLRARGLLDDDKARTFGIEPSLLVHADLCKRMTNERARFFASKRASASSPLASAPFAFAIDPARITGAFAPAFGLDASRPLTPTRLEAMAECRMHGFIQHVLKVDVDPPAGNAADARVLGTLAHEVMELFFRERKAARVPASRVTDADRARVRALLALSAEPLLQGRAATGHLGAIRAQIAWLETALVRAVSMLARDPVVPGVEPVDFEVRFGPAPAAAAGAPAALVAAEAFASVPVQIGARTVFLGGIIDRVDEGEHHRVVIDYKSSGTGAIKRKVKRDALFEKHFQLLLYLRLLEHHRQTPEPTMLHGYLVSLRDGTTSDDVTEVEDLRARILDDTRADGLAAGVGRVILPILEGTLPPDAGDRCDTCRLQRVCRVPLAAEFAADLDDVDEGASP